MYLLYTIIDGLSHRIHILFFLYWNKTMFSGNIRLQTNWRFLNNYKNINKFIILFKSQVGKKIDLP